MNYILEKVQSRRDRRRIMDAKKQHVSLKRFYPVFMILLMNGSSSIDALLPLNHPRRSRAQIGDYFFPSSSFVSTALLGLALILGPAVTILAAPAGANAVVEEQQRLYLWQFENGEVALPATTRIGDLRLTHPKLLGSGAGGAVFAMKQQQQQQQQSANSNEDMVASSLVALKVSWRGSATGVANECRILQTLQKAQTARAAATLTGPSSSSTSSSSSSLEICLGIAAYPGDASSSIRRTMIALQPVFADEQAATFHDLPDQERLETAVTSAIQTMLQLLSAGIVTVDVQPLISLETGKLLFVDFTEAVQVVDASGGGGGGGGGGGDDGSLSDSGAAAVSSFVSEIMALIPPDQQETTASTVLLQQLNMYPMHSQQIYDVLLAQNFSKQALDILQVQKSAMER